jgi:hypothetical protein
VSGLSAHFYNDLIQRRRPPAGGLLNIHEVSNSLLILSLYNLICSVAAVSAADQSLWCAMSVKAPDR